MPITMFEASIPVFQRGLAILPSLLDKAAEHAATGGPDEVALLQLRLAPDMLPLAGQIQRASDTAKFAAARLTGAEAPSFADEETTFAQLRERCAGTVAYLTSLSPAAFEGSETRSITFGGGANRWTLLGERYLLQFALPNFFFHVTTAYDLLRHGGVPVGKRDYLGPFEPTA